MKYRNENELIYEAYKKSLVNEADTVSGSMPTTTPSPSATTSSDPTGPKPASTFNPKKPLGQALPQITPGPNTKNAAIGASKVLQNTFNSLQNQSDVNAAKQAATQALNTLSTYDRDLKFHAPLSKDIQTANDVPTLQQMVGKYLQWAQGLSK